MDKRLKPLFRNILALFLLANMLMSCSTGNKFASSFGKRKYTKGYYVDFISKPKAEPRITQHEATTAQTKVIRQDAPPAIIVSGKRAGVALKKAHPVGGKRPVSISKAVIKQNEPVSIVEVERPKHDRSSNQLTVEPEANTQESDIGAVGFVVSVIGIILLTLGKFAGSLDVSLIVLLIGAVICVIAIGSSDRNIALAVVGAIIDGLVLISLVFILIHLW
jgi:hypothetical protein